MKKNKHPWSTKATMEQIYQKKLWGGKVGLDDFYSGNGSHDSELIFPYLEAVIQFLQSFKTKISLCDLGCGDFNIGSSLVEYSRFYIGVDIVSDLIERNKKMYPAFEFKCLDISEDNLPDADCAIIRQVLQHLSNLEITKIVKKLSKYKYIVLSEHIPNGYFEPNKNKISSMGIRLKNNSGVDITKAPFNFKFKNSKELVSVEDKKWKGRIVTTLYESI
tara:strand:+ start:598 stop:1254 length:657 start_codon:yes stop_codon:yes gene_type:complete